MSTTQNEHQWGMFAHLSALFFGFLGPLVIWLMKKDTMPFVNDQAKEALNFQITLLIVYIVLIILSATLSHYIGLLVLLCGLAALVFIIIGAIKANGGNNYRYPFALRLIK